MATIVSKALREKDYKRPPAFPYKDTQYGFIAAVMDKTTHRFDENSRIIVVDGPIASGKTKFAQVWFWLLNGHSDILLIFKTCLQFMGTIL